MNDNKGPVVVSMDEYEAFATISQRFGVVSRERDAAVARVLELEKMLKDKGML